MTLTCAFTPFATVGSARYFLSALRRFTTCIFVLFAISTARRRSREVARWQHHQMDWNKSDRELCDD